MNFEEFVKKVDDTFMIHQAARPRGKISTGLTIEERLSAKVNQWRYGQTVMNVLYDVWPEKYNEIKDSDINCFYSNSNVQYVLDKLEKEWKLK